MEKLYGLNEIACNSMINGYLHARRVEDALKVLERMKEHNTCTPSNVTANTFVSYYCSTGDLLTAPAVLEYFASLGYPSLPIDHSNMFRLFARSDQLRAEKLLAMLLESGKPLDVVIYNAILSTMLDRNVPLSFRQTIAAMIVPTITPIKVDSLAGLCINANTDVRQIIARMEHDGVEPNSLTYDLAMRALRSRKDHDGIIHVFKRLSNSGQAVHGGHRNSYLGALIAKGDSPELRTTVQAMNTRRYAIHGYNLNRLIDMGIEVTTSRIRSIRSNRPAPESQQDTQFESQQEH
jgi:pentatricopeptide repeat protein